jgi:hypothetical protein
MLQGNSFVTNLATNIVTKVIIVLVVGVMFTIVTIDFQVTTVKDVPMVTFGTMVTKATFVHCVV